MRYFFASIFFLVLLIVPTLEPAAAANLYVGLYEQCAPVFNKVNGVIDEHYCTDNLRCASIKSGPTIASIPMKYPDSPVPQQACFPKKEYQTCGAGGDCTKRTDGNIECVTVVNVSSPSKYAPVCLNKTESPQDDDVKDLCQTSKECDTGKQCVRIVAWETTWADEWVGVKKCIDVQKLPAAVLEAGKGSCGQNASCSATQSCVENTYEPSSLKSYVCYAQQMIGAACTNIAAECAFGAKKGTCMYVYDGGAKQARCIDHSLLPNGPQSNSQQTCKADSDCKAEAGYTFCLSNPATKQNNCFSQKTIFTDMSKLPQQLCNGAPCPCIFPDKPGCEPTGQESICAAYATKPGTAVCIKYASAGAALGTGAGAASTDHNVAAPAAPNVATETYERFAPKLQIDIPNLSFTEKIVAQASSQAEGSHTFFVPYLATYINAVYKYALGLGVLIAIIMIMFAGFRWMSSFGNVKAVSEAKSMIGNSVFGLGLLFSAYTVLYIINPDLPQMKAIQIIAPKQEVFDVKNDDAAPEAAPGVAGTPGGNALIRSLIGDLPPNTIACSPAAAQIASQKLHDLGVCVGGCHCAFTASAVLDYLGCTKISNGNAYWYAAELDNSGWTSIRVTSENKKNLPVGLLLGEGHVGVSVGNGIQFQSASSKKNKFLEQVNSKTGDSCPYKIKDVKANPAQCKTCARVPGHEPWSGKYCDDTQAWNRSAIWPTYWKFVVYPAAAGAQLPAKISCKISWKGLSKTLTITKELCDYIQAGGARNEQG